MKTKEYKVPLDEYAIERLRVRLRTEKNNLIDMVYQYETFLFDEWVPIVRFDCAHGFFHKDEMYPNGDKVKTTFEFDSMKSASDYAGQDLRDRWPWYKERYLKKIRK